MKRVFVFALVLIVALPAAAQEPFPGVTLITPLRSTETFLIDMSQATLQTWHGDNGAGHTVYLLPDNSVIRSQGDPNGIFRSGGAGGHLQRINAADEVVWDFFLSNAETQQHHDIEPMPNGNVLAITWERHTQEEATALGRTEPMGNELFPTRLVELRPVGLNDAEVVWEWSLWDHMVQDSDPAKPNYGVIADHPQLVDINLGGGGRSWDHGNYVDYNAELDQIVYSARALNEILVIDHSTTARQAAGHTGGRSGRGGDILYRWGNPQNYGRGTEVDQVFHGVHGANWINPGLPGAGGILAFNNGNRPGDADDASSVVEIQPPRDRKGRYRIENGKPYGPAAPVWEYAPGGPAFFSLRYGSAYRLPNGNTLICEGVDGLIFEVTPAAARVWSYLEPAGNGVFAAQRYWRVPDGWVTVDVMPRSCPNRFSLRGVSVPANARADNGTAKAGILQVVIPGTPSLHVDEIEATSLHLAGVLPQRHLYVDRVGPPTEDECACATDGRDGLLDLVLHFSRADVALAMGDVMDGDVVTLTLTGMMKDGAFLEAEDCVTIVDDRSGPPPHARRDGPRPGALHAAAPSPFNPTTTIRYEIVDAGPVSLNIYDVTGRLVRRLVDEVQAPVAGGHAVRWDGRTDAGEAAPSGVYFYRLLSQGLTKTRKMVMLK